MSDTLATVELYNKFKEILTKNNIITIEDIHSFSIKSAKDCRLKIKI